jgi:hypothetical protein
MLSNPAMALWVALISIPFLWSIGSKYEGLIFPVVSNTSIVDFQEKNNGVYINVAFEKSRQCEFVGISWYDEFNIRHGVEFEPDANLSPITRPIGSQVSGPWLIKGMANLKRSRAVVSHNCHPLWTTHTIFYP